MRALATLALVSMIAAHCALVAPPPGPTRSPPTDEVLYVENRGGPEYVVSVGGKPLLTVGCGESDVLTLGRQGVPALPWDLDISRARDGATLVKARVDELPRWFVQLGEEVGSGGLSRVPILGPVIECPPQASPTADPYAGLPSNACGGLHLKIVNDRADTVRVAINGRSVIVVAPRSTETLIESFLAEPVTLPWEVEVTDDETGARLFNATMVGPVDQVVTLGEGTASQAPYDLASEGC
jgi:hypothetical protein